MQEAGFHKQIKLAESHARSRTQSIDLKVREGVEGEGWKGEWKGVKGGGRASEWSNSFRDNNSLSAGWSTFFRNIDINFNAPHGGTLHPDGTRTLNNAGFVYPGADRTMSTLGG